MTAEQILKLGEMGYTKDEITAMAKTAAEPEKKEPEKKEPEKKEPEKEGNPIAEMKASIDALTKALQASNLKGAEVKEEEKTETVDDMLKKFLGGM